MGLDFAAGRLQVDPDDPGLLLERGQQQRLHLCRRTLVQHGDPGQVLDRRQVGHPHPQLPAKVVGVVDAVAGHAARIDLLQRNHVHPGLSDRPHLLRQRGMPHVVITVVDVPGRKAQGLTFREWLHRQRTDRPDAGQQEDG